MSAARRTPLAELPRVYVRDRAAWRAWLATHHDRSPGIWLVYDKKASRADRLAYADAVEEALCFGWIDSLVRALDDAQYLQLFTPRKPRSAWSPLNRQRVARLTRAGLMMPAGLAAVAAGKRHGTWNPGAKAPPLPSDPAAVDAALAAALATLPPGLRRNLEGWITGARRPETRARRVAEVIARVAARAAKKTAAPRRARRSS